MNDIENIIILGGIILAVILLIVIIWIVYYVRNILPIKRRRRFFQQIFYSIKFKSVDGSLPYYIKETRISEYALSIAFNTLIPLKVWLARKDILEMSMNYKIIDIKQSESYKRFIYVIVEIQELPTEIIWEDEYIPQGNKFNIGVCYYGDIILDIEKHPHAFVAGESGSGKSNILKCLIHQAIIKRYDVILIDFKRGVSFTDFRDKVTIYYEYKEVIQVLKKLVDETIYRLDMFRVRNVDNLNDYVRISKIPMSRKIVFIDELAELLKTRDKTISTILCDSIETLTRLARAVGIHLIMGIQRPDSTVINGQIKSNVSYRLCGHFVDREPSRIMLGTEVASTLPNIKGRFIVKDNEIQELQCFRFYRPYRAKQAVENDIPSASENDVQEAEAEVNNAKIEKPKKDMENVSENEFEFDFSDFKKKNK